jgi:hypothetical protein
MLPDDPDENEPPPDPAETAATWRLQMDAMEAGTAADRRHVATGTVHSKSLHIKVKESYI